MTENIGTVTFSGIGSGQNFDELITKLTDNEEAIPKKKLDQREMIANEKLTSYGNLKGSFTTLQKSLTTLKNANEFQGKSATITNDTTVSADTVYFTANVTSNRIPNTSYTVEVEQLATSHKLASSVFNTSSTILGTGTLRLTVGAGQDNSAIYDIAIGSDDSSLSGIAAAINNRTGTTGVAATLITSDAGVQLVIAANNTGIKNTLNVDIIDDSSGTDIDNTGLSQLTYNDSIQNMTQIVSPLDANVRIDGQLISSSTNKMVNVIKGINIELFKAEDSKIHTLKINTDIEKSKDIVKKFVEDFNEVVNTINDLTKVDFEKPENDGALVNDITVMNISFQLKNIISQKVNSPIYNSLISIGVSTNKNDGKLEITAAGEGRLSTALTADVNAIINLFTDEDEGIAVKLFNKVNDLVKSNGTIDLQFEGFKREFKNIEKERKKLEVRIENFKAQLTKRMGALDALITKFNATSEHLQSSVSNFVKPLSFRNKQ